MSGYTEGFSRGTNYCHRSRTARYDPAAAVPVAASQRARCERGEHDEAVAGEGRVTYLAHGQRVQPGTRYCRYCSAVLPAEGEQPPGKTPDGKAAGLTPRVAHVLHALMARWADRGEAVTAAEVCEYDSEALTVRHTVAGLMQARRLGFAENLAPGLWIATDRAWAMPAPRLRASASSVTHARGRLRRSAVPPSRR
jgi:hypothetical protein